MELIILLVIVIVLMLVVTSMHMHKLEKRNFNNGICPKCKTPLTQFEASTSSEARGYECLNCGYTTWVEQYSMTDRNYRKKYPR